MILHIADDEKFLDHSITMFEAVYPGENIYLVNTDAPLLYIKSTHKNIICCSYNTKEYNEIINDKFSYKAVIFHDLIHPYKWELAVKLPLNMHLHWFCYGNELYTIPYLRKDLYLPLTKAVMAQDFKLKLKNGLEEKAPILYNTFYKAFKGEQTLFLKFKNAVERCRSFSSPVADEILYVQKYLNQSIKYIPYHHITLDQMVCHVKNQICEQQDFLVGNSANPTNNHIDTFETLKGITADHKVYVPLSYPKNKSYIESVKTHGEVCFKNSFKPLTSFMSMEEYSSILKKCGNVVMNFNRQQGIANIVLAFYLGAKVYINSSNISYQYFKKHGLKFYDINELNSTTINLTNNLELAKHNRVILERFYAENVVMDAAQNLVNTLLHKN